MADVSDITDVSSPEKGTYTKISELPLGERIALFIRGLKEAGPVSEKEAEMLLKYAGLPKDMLKKLAEEGKIIITTDGVMAA